MANKGVNNARIGRKKFRLLVDYRVYCTVNIYSDFYLCRVFLKILLIIKAFFKISYKFINFSFIAHQNRSKFDTFDIYNYKK